METKAVVVCTFAGVLGLLSAALGFAAEATKVKGSEISVDVSNDVCINPSSPASVLGFISAVSLLVAFIITHSASGCFCCYTTTARRCQCGSALVCFIFSWVTFIPGFLLMLGTASLSRSNNMTRLRTRDESYRFSSSYYYYCYYVKNGVFAAAACLSLISVILGIICYINMNSASRNSGPPTAPGAGNIAMGQPQVPPQHNKHQPAYV